MTTSQVEQGCCEILLLLSCLLFKLKSSIKMRKQVTHAFECADILEQPLSGLICPI